MPHQDSSQYLATSPELPPASGKKHLAVLIALILIAIMATAGVGWWYYYPSFQEAPIDASQWTLVYQDRLYPGQVLVDKGSVLIALPFLQEKLDSSLFWDDAENTAVITTKDKLITMNTQQLTAHINNRPVEISASPILIDGIPFLPIDFLAQLYLLHIDVLDHNRRVVIQKTNEPVAIASVISEKAYLRILPTIRSARITGLAQDEQLVILKEKLGFYLVRTSQGLIGYLDKRAAQFTSVIMEEQQLNHRPSWRPMGGEINLTWEYVNKKTADPATIGKLPGVNVVSPTWFHLKDGEGNLENNADLRYVNWAHDNGYQVWGLITNRFDRDLTHAVLFSTATRQKVIDQLLVLAQLYRLDGINIDFENMHLKDRDLLTQFLRELTPLAHEQGLTISIDVTIRSTSENWSMIYDRKALGQIVDYMAVMTYDEHWAASPKAGSVASLPWVERGLVGVLEEVPKEKILLGIPFYTRVWEETPQPDGSIKVSSRALSMAAAENLIRENGAQISYDEKAQQDYAQWSRGNSTFKIWLENETSITKRVQLARQYDLAGIASWRRGFEKVSIWLIIRDELIRR
jgi:spore germination protein YaaH